MGQFDNKETPKSTEHNAVNFDTTQLVKTAEMLDEDLYWGIIENNSSRPIDSPKDSL
jgi:hypothetical protein